MQKLACQHTTTTDLNGNEVPIYRMEGVLKSLPNGDFLQNTLSDGSEGARYKLATVEVTTPAGNNLQVSAAIFEKNLEQGGDNMIVGDHYLTTARSYDGRVYFQLSHLPYSGAIDAAAEGFVFAEVEDAVEVEKPTA